MVFVTIGKLLADYKLNIEKIYRKLLIVFICLLCEILLVQSISLTNDCFLCLLPFTLLFSYMLIEKGKGFKCKDSIAYYCRKSSILVYLLHPMIIYGLSQNGYERGLELFILALSFSLVGAIIIVYSSSKIVFLKYLY